jgi:hypothetical protein
VPTGRRSGAVVRLLTGGRRSLEGERAVVEQSHCDALKWEPEPVNPRVGTGKWWCLGSPSRTLTESELVTAGLGKPRGCF